MPYSRIIISILLIGLTQMGFGQTFDSQEEVDIKSYRLFTNQQWQQLERYGKQAIKNNIDFILLRLRIGYACIMQQRYAEASKQYEAVLKKDRYNETARYYSWISMLCLNEPELALFHASYLPKTTLKKEGLQPTSLTKVDWEGSYKVTDLTTRFDGFYHRIGIGGHLGWRWSMYNAAGIFQQKIDEPGLTSVVNNRNIQVNQTEFYHLSTFILNKRFQVKAGYHFINTPFNNFLYQNHIGILGLKYHSPYLQIQATAYQGQLIDSSLQQLQLQASIFPLGNNQLYGISTISDNKHGSKSQINFKQVIGFKLFESCWAEAHATLGKFQNILENDGLYVYNAIDPTLIKLGGNLYFSPTRRLTLQGGYTFEEKNLYTYPNFVFYQHSINGGIKWTF